MAHNWPKECAPLAHIQEHSDKAMSVGRYPFRANVKHKLLKNGIKLDYQSNVKATFGLEAPTHSDY